jgi:uncharacterized phage-associated protein
MAYDGRAVANQVVDQADGLGLRLTHMAVHKIVFFAHGWRLAQRNEALIRQQFEAWNYGPVLRSVYDALKCAGRGNVTTRVRGLDPVTRVTFPIRADFSPEDQEFLRAILLAYGRYSAAHLSTLTHRPGGAWDRIWNAPNGRITLGMRIANEAIQEDFLTGRMNPADPDAFSSFGASRH